MTEKPHWLEKAKETFKYHRSQLLSHNKWTIAMTSKALRRSFGSVAEDLLIAKWCKTHERELEKIEFACDVLAWIRKKKKEMDTDEICLYLLSQKFIYCNH